MMARSSAAPTAPCTLASAASRTAPDGGRRSHQWTLKPGEEDGNGSTTDLSLIWQRTQDGYSAFQQSPGDPAAPPLRCRRSPGQGIWDRTTGMQQGAGTKD